MLTLELFTWWFSQGWLQVIKGSGRRLVRISNVFSVPILLRTLLAPWRRIITYPGASIDAQLRALADNLVSRLIGFTVRIIVLITASLVLLVTLVVSILSIVLWPLVPIAVFGLLIKGFGP
jgi:hypothetical protein